MNAAPYRRGVLNALTAQGESDELSEHENTVVSMGEKYGIGPYDCACQIVANRQDMRSE